MPARKSCASRIIGEREVRPIAVSTSFSIAASVPCDDLDEDRVDVWVRQPVAVLVCRGRPARHCASVTTRLPNASTVAAKPGCTGTVEPNSSMTAGPATTSPARRSGRQ